MSTTPDSDAPNWMGLAVEATFDINHHPGTDAFVGASDCVASTLERLTPRTSR